MPMTLLSKLAPQRLIRTQCIREALSLAPRKSLAFADFDDTLCATLGVTGSRIQDNVAGIGSQLWAHHYYHNNKGILGEQAAYLRTVELFSLMRKEAILQPVEETTAEAFSSLYQQASSLVWLTAQDISVAQYTYEAITSTLGFFNVLSDAPDFSFSVDSDTVDFSKGVIYCRGNDKGKCLEAFYKTTVGRELFVPVDHVFFVDDSIDNCHSVLSSLKLIDYDVSIAYYDHVKQCYNSGRSYTQEQADADEPILKAYEKLLDKHQLDLNNQSLSL